MTTGIPQTSRAAGTPTPDDHVAVGRTGADESAAACDQVNKPAGSGQGPHLIADDGATVTAVTLAATAVMIALSPRRKQA